MSDLQHARDPVRDPGAQAGPVGRTVVWTSRTLIWLPGRGREAEGYAATASAIERAAKERGLSVLRRSPYLLAAEIGNGAPSINGMGKLVLLEAFRGSISARAADASFALESVADLHDWCWNALSFYRLILATPDSLLIESDPLDVKPMYRAEHRSGTLLGSRLVDLFAIEPGLRKPIDPMGLYDLAYLGFPGGKRTLHRKVSRAEAGERYLWRPGSELRVERPRRIPIPGPKPGLDAGEAVRGFDRMLKDAITSRLEGAAGDVFVGLSGGFDSRLLAATCMTLGRHVTAVTYGLPQHREARIAREVARAIGIDHRMIGYADRILLSRREHFLSTVESQAGPAICQITNLLDIAAAGPSSLLHGYLVDPLAGSTLGWLPHEAFLSRNAMAEGIARRFVRDNELGEWFAQRYGLTMVDCVDWVRATLRDDGEPYQQLTMWNLENRQRRYIGCHMSLLGPRYHLVTPFYSSEMLQAWLSVPRLGLEGRALFRLMLARLHPLAARIPHAEEIHSITPNFKWLSRAYLRWGAQVVRKRLAKAGLLRLIGSDPSADDIWRLSYSLTPEDRAEMEAAVRAADAVSQDVLEFSPAELMRSAARPTPRVCRTAWAIASYAEMLSGKGDVTH